jgi:tetratricopeptide (TPR) repeat protein
MPSDRLPWLLAASLLLLTLAAYGQLWENHFINFDDRHYITHNPPILGGLTASGIRWAWTTFDSGNWIPLTWMSLQVDASLSSLLQGPRSKQLPLAWVVHGQNLFWHCATVGLLFATLRRLTGAMWCSALVAALFAVHPLHVESVAWAIERKDVLSTFFGMLTLLAYGHYVQRPSVGRYLLVLTAFVLSLLAKPMLVTLPCLLLLLDWWPLRRFSFAQSGRLVLEKVPLFAVAAAACVLALVAQHHAGALASVGYLSFPSRLANAVASCGWYLEKTFWPTNLAIYYCHPGDNRPWDRALLAAIILLAVTVLALGTARRWPWLLVGWLWFLGTLVPVIGLVQVGDQARADRYTYVPHIGLFVALIWSGAALVGPLRLPIWVPAALGTTWVLLLSAATWAQVGCWHDSRALWGHAVAVTTENHRAHYCLGLTLFELALEQQNPKLHTQAGWHFEQAALLQPDDFQYRARVGEFVLNEGRLDLAAEHLQAAVRLNPGAARSWHNLGVLQRRQQDYVGASGSFRRELELTPQTADAHAEMGLVLWHLRRRQQASEHWQTALQLDPYQPEALHGVGLFLLRQGHNQEAEVRLATAVQVNPLFIRAWSSWGLALFRLRQWERASQCQARAVELQTQRTGTEEAQTTDLVFYLCRLGMSLNAEGFPEKAQPQYAEATKKRPSWPQTHLTQAWRLATAPDPEDRDPATAWELATQVCQGAGESAEALDVLAAALARLERYTEAVQTAQQARARAAPHLALAIQGRIQLYQRDQPYEDRRQ